ADASQIGGCLGFRASSCQGLSRYGPHLSARYRLGIVADRDRVRRAADVRRNDFQVLRRPVGRADRRTKASARPARPTRSLTPFPPAGPSTTISGRQLSSSFNGERLKKQWAFAGNTGSGSGESLRTDDEQMESGGQGVALLVGGVDEHTAR